MTLRGKKPESIEKRLKLLMYGTAGVGKTTAAINFPAPYLIDTERGAENDQYIEILNKNNGVIFQNNIFDEIVQEVLALLSEDHPYKTLIIDPITTVYNDLLEVCAKDVGTEFGRHYGEANKRMKHLLNLLLRLDMNVIITAHSKNEYGDNLAVLGQTFDGYKKLDYLFDLVIELQKTAGKRFGLVKKSRVKQIDELERFEFSYDILADKFGKKKIEKETVKQELASSEQIERVEKLIDLLKIPEETYQKWWSKAKANGWNEFKKEDIQKCIDLLETKIKEK